MVNIDVLSQIQYGVFVVTSCAQEKITGQIATVVFQITIEPIQIVTCLHKSNFTHQLILESKKFGVSILSQQVDLKFIGRFGFHTGRNFDKFAGVNYKETPTGTPLVLDYAVGVLDLQLQKTVDVGTHTLFVGRVITAEMISDKLPITYAYYHDVIKGKTHKNAPTFQAKVTS